MANPYDKFLNTDSVTKNNSTGNSYEQYLPAGSRSTKSPFSISTEDPPVDYTKPYEMPDEKNPYSKYLDKGYFNTGTQEDIDLGKKISNAFYLGFIDTARGLRQMSTANEDVLNKLRADQKKIISRF